MQDAKLYERFDDSNDTEIITLDRAAYNQGKNAKYDFSIIEGGSYIHSLQEALVQSVTKDSRCALCNRLQVSATTADRTGKGGDRDG